MPISRRVTTQQINKTVFQCFSPDGMSDDEEARWEDTGAFPRVSPNSSKNHIFTDDDTFENDFATLEIVEEGSKETQDANSQEDFTAAASTTSSDTPAVDNRFDEAVRKILNNQKQAPAPAPPPSQGGSSGSNSKTPYPFDLYRSLTHPDDKKLQDQNNASSVAGASQFTDKQATNASFASGSSTSRNSNAKKGVGEESSMPSPANPMSVGEESSGMSETQSQAALEAASNAAPHSVISARSRRHSRRYMVRHTLSTSQQVNANPTTMLKNLFIGIEQERHMHKLAGQNLNAVHNWFMFLPCIFLTLLSGIAVFVFQADLHLPAEATVYSSIFAGVAAIFSVFLQSVSKMLDLGTRGTLHDITACVLKRLSEDILLTLSSSETIPAEYVALVSDKLGQALDSCTSPLPYKAEAAFSAVSDRMVLMLKPPMGQPARKYLHKLDCMRMYSTVYDELSSEIIHSWAWPFMFPRPRSASEAALRNFKAIVTEGREAVQRMQGCVRALCPCLGEDAVEKSLFEVVPAASVAENSDNTTNSNNPYQIRNAMLRQEV